MTKHFTLDSITLDCGRTLKGVTLAYETYGKLTPARDNAVLLCHSFSGSAAASVWWEKFVGEGLAFDTGKYFVICSNVLGGCYGSTGPASMDAEADRPYALGFPQMTMQDMVRAQWELVQKLGVDRLHCVAGGSMGGILAFQFAATYPEAARKVLPMNGTTRLNTRTLAYHKALRQAVMSDPDWLGGAYYGVSKPVRGLMTARMIGEFNYYTEEYFEREFGQRRVRGPESGFSDLFEIERHMSESAKVFAEGFDANSFIYISRAMDLFDIPLQFGSLAKAYEGSAAEFLVVSSKTDWLFPAHQSSEAAAALSALGKPVKYLEIGSIYGHDSFLHEDDVLTPPIKDFLK
jgi:homoserine O-acetyltransferase/O-succinyltransferase